MKYTKNEIENFNQKDKRISWQAIFKSLIESNRSDLDKLDIADLESLAHQINDRLYEIYPFIEEDNTTGEKTINADEIPA